VANHRILIGHLIAFVLWYLKRKLFLVNGLFRLLNLDFGIPSLQHLFVLLGHLCRFILCLRLGILKSTLLIALCLGERLDADLITPLFLGRHRFMLCALDAGAIAVAN